MVCMIAVAASFDATAIAQFTPSKTRRSSVNRTERNARASWQPVRAHANTDADASFVAEADEVDRAATSRTKAKTASANPGQRHAVRQVNHLRGPAATRSTNNRRQTGVVRQAGHGIPAPPNPPSSVVEVPIEVAPLDAQIALTPIDGPVHDGYASCDAMPVGSDCSCGVEGCFGGSCEVGCGLEVACGVDAACGIDAGCDGGCCDGGCDSIGGCCNFDSGSCNSCCGELCSGKAWSPCVTLCLPQDGWVALEYLHWYQDGMSLPPLVTTSVDPNVAQANAGVLGQAPTRVLFGGNDVLDGSFSGHRIKGGLWLDKCHTWALAGDYFQIGMESESFFANSTGTPILARPFFNANPASGSPREDSELVAFANGPAILSGAVGVVAESELKGAGIHLRRLRQCKQGCSNWYGFGSCGEYCSRTEAMFGLRYMQLDERVRINENLNATAPQAGRFAITDQFRTNNRFNGIDLGWVYRETRGIWVLDTMLRMGVGMTRQRVSIEGSTVISGSGIDDGTFEGGLLTQTGTNIGSHKRDEFSIIPELNINLGCQLTDNWKAYIGYNFLYWSNVVRPGEHIDRQVNPNFLPPPETPIAGPRVPGFAFDATDYWAHGINLGLEYRW